MNYLNLFDNYAAYSAAKSGLLKPNVSFCQQENEMYFEPYIRPDLCYRYINSYYVLCNNKGNLYVYSDHGDRYYLGWNDSSTQLFHNMAPSGNWSVISNAVTTYGAVYGISFSVTTTSGVSRLTNNTFTWQGNSYTFNNGIWTPSIPGGEYIDSNIEVK